METCIILKYRVQNNVLVEKLKEVQNSKILKIVCRALWENTRETYMFVVHQMETHDKHICLLCVFLLRTTKGMSLPCALS
jgi:hypothetical protein